MNLVQTWKRSFDRWSSDETEKLIEAWSPVYLRRRSGVKDPWVPLNIPGRARSSRALVVEDWRAVAFKVNSYRANIGLDSCRTHSQCMNRMSYLKSQYVKGVASRLEWPFFQLLDAVWAAEVGGRGAGAVEGGGAPAGDAGGSIAAAGASAADHGGCAVADNTNDGGSIDACGAAADAEPARRRSFVGGSTAAAAVPKKPRSAKPAGSPAASMAAVSELAADVTVADLSADILPAGSVDAAVVINLSKEVTKLAKEVTKLGEIYKDVVRMKTGGHVGASSHA